MNEIRTFERAKAPVKSLPQKFFSRLRDALGISLLHERMNTIEQTLEFMAARTVEPSPVDKFITQSSYYFKGGHFTGHYIEWRVRRMMKILQIYGADYFPGKRVLELGGGLGDIGGFIASLGAEVVSLEARRSNYNYANLRYGTKYKYKSVEMDLEKDFSHIGRFDLIINFGLIEVIQNIDQLMKCCTKISDDILLETVVCDSTDKTKVINTKVNTFSSDHPIYGLNSHPSPFYIEEFFKNNGFAMERYFDQDLNTKDHIYDWAHKNDNSSPGLRRFWRFQKTKN